MLDTYHRSGECLCCHQSIDEDISSENNLIFEEETDTRCKVVEYKRYYNDERDDFVVIPRSWQGKEVYSVAENALKDKKNIGTIPITENVTYIDDYFFSNCTYLVNVYLANVLSIDSYAFSSCTSLS